MIDFDLIIVGGGMTGLTLATLLNNTNCKIAIIESALYDHFDLDRITYRVSALNLASEKLLRHVGAWQHIEKWRSTAYDKMLVKEKDSFAEISFDTQGLGISHLGHIVENNIIQHALLQQAQSQKNIEIIQALPTSLGTNQSSAIITLDSGEVLTANLVVGADGAQSWVRAQADIPLNFRHYGHSALVCNVKTTQPHENCARQLFYPDGVLAFLPLHQSHLSSIVWSLAPEKAAYLAKCNLDEFNKALYATSDGILGLCETVSERADIPLIARYARNFVRHRVALIGDAAHTIHPLAGLGVNLGFLDSAGLAQEIEKNLKLHNDIGQLRYLRHFERWRKTEAVKMLSVMRSFKEVFSGANQIKKLIRGIGLSFTNHFPFLKQQLIKQALGVEGDIPDILK